MSLLAQIDADLDAFFDTETGFAKAASYTPQGGEAVSTSVIFDGPHQIVTPSAAFANTSPTALGRTSVFQSAKVNVDTLTIGETVYVIKEVKPDSTGTTLLTLKRQ